MEEKLDKLQSCVILVKPDKKIIENSFAENVNQWRKRKSMFKGIWDNITENRPNDQKEFKVFAAFPLHLLPFDCTWDLPFPLMQSSYSWCWWIICICSKSLALSMTKILAWTCSLTLTCWQVLTKGVKFLADVAWASKSQVKKSVTEVLPTTHHGSAVSYGFCSWAVPESRLMMLSSVNI